MVNVDEVEVEDVIAYTTAVEVDGICGTLDAFMKKQEESNENMQKNLEEIKSLMVKNSPHLAGFKVEDKGSNVKGKPTAYTSKPPPRDPPPFMHQHKSTHFGPGNHSIEKQFVVPPPTYRAHFIPGDKVEWSTRAQGTA